MKNVILTVISTLLVLISVAQNPKVKNLGIEIKDDKVLFNYDLIAKDTNKIQTVELFLIDNDYNICVPKKIKGDYGKAVLPGENKLIEWDVYKDDVIISQKLKPKIVVNGIKKGGASNAVYSILVPGLGDYFVADHKDMFIKPYIRTLATLGIFGLGIYATIEREEIPIYGWVEKYSGWGNDEIVWDIKGYKYDNAFFSNDAELLLITGATLWIADIIWVFMKGMENDKLRIFSNYSLGVEKGYSTLKYSITF